MSTIAVNAITDAAGGNTATINGMTPTADSLQGFRNRIINGDMRIDQRNAGASVTVGAGASYQIDRWQSFSEQASKFSVQRSTVVPTGFTNSLLATSLSAYSVLTGDRFIIRQNIEGFNVADLGWGTANAQSVTVSFWVRSSLTGSFGGFIGNSAIDRSYPFSYTISAANTWEQKTITIPGDTTGTWLTDNGVGLRLGFSLGAGATYSGTAGAWASSQILQPTGSVSVVGTSGATFYITGVQLEAGSVATPFERRPYGTELQLCQRYYFKIQASGDNSTFGIGMGTTTTVADCLINFPVPMRIAPSALEQSGTASDYRVRQGGSEITCSVVPSNVFTATQTTANVRATVSSGLTVASSIPLRSTTSSAYLAWSAEL